MSRSVPASQAPLGTRAPGSTAGSGEVAGQAIAPPAWVAR
jgi:hypothetical protein